MKQSSQHELSNNALIRGVFFVLGFVFLGLGILGVILPGMPTTVFIILAGYCWAKSSRRFYQWLLNHKIFGKMLIDWQERRAMPKVAKYIAWSMMAFSSALMFYRMPPDKMWIAFLVAGFSLAVSIWMAKLPNA